MISIWWKDLFCRAKLKTKLLNILLGIQHESEIRTLFPDTRGGGYSVRKLLGVCRGPLKIGPKKIEGKMVFWGQKDQILWGFVPKRSFLCWWMRKNTPKRSSLVPRGSKKGVKTAAHMYHPSYREYPPWVLTPLQIQQCCHCNYIAFAWVCQINCYQNKPVKQYAYLANQSQLSSYQPMENSHQAAILEADFTCWQAAGTAWCIIILGIVMECMFVIWICSRPKVSLCFEPHASWLCMQKPYLFVLDLTTCAVRPPQDRPQHWLFLHVWRWDEWLIKTMFLDNFGLLTIRPRVGVCKQGIVTVHEHGSSVQPANPDAVSKWPRSNMAAPTAKLTTTWSSTSSGKISIYWVSNSTQFTKWKLTFEAKMFITSMSGGTFLQGWN